MFQDYHGCVLRSPMPDIHYAIVRNNPHQSVDVIAYQGNHKALYLYMETALLRYNGYRLPFVSSIANSNSSFVIRNAFFSCSSVAVIIHSSARDISSSRGEKRSPVSAETASCSGSKERALSSMARAKQCSSP